MPVHKTLMVAAAMLLIGRSSVVAGPIHDAVKDGDLTRLRELVEASERRLEIWTQQTYKDVTAAIRRAKEVLGE